MFSRVRMDFAIVTTLLAGFACATYLQPADALGQPASTPTSVAIPAEPNEPAVTLLDLKVDPTIACIGVTWNVRGDSNGNATGKLEFREAGSSEWKSAFPMLRKPYRDNMSTKYRGNANQWGDRMRDYAVEHFRQNYIAGSIVGLKPATQYELRITVADPDGGGAAKTTTITTRPVPTIPKGGHIVEVRGGGDALKKALESAQAGDIFNVHAGTYNGGVVVEASGTAEQPICIRAAGDGEVLLLGGEGPKSDVWLQGDKSNLDGIHVKGAYVWIEGLSFYNFRHCVWGQGASDLAVMRCKMNHFFNGIFTSSQRGYYADNSIRESYNALDMTLAPGKRNEGSGIWVTTGGDFSVICYNEISLVADGIRTYCGGCDAYGNDVIFNVDDGIELDNGDPNLRVMDNRWSFTGENGLSFQPHIGGPAYLIRNLVIGQRENPLKNRYDSDGAIFINNTLVCFDRRAIDIPFGSITRNNLFLMIPGKDQPSAQVDISPERLRLLDMDYDGFSHNGLNGMFVKEIFSRTGLEKHGVQFNSNAEVLAIPPGMFEEYNSKQWSAPQAFLTTKTRPHPDLSLRKGSSAIGAGVTVPNLMERADGKAPDLGALQFGQPAPHYGPRP